MSDNIKTTILVNNYVVKAGLKGEHGWSVLVETPTGSVLFDTGQSNLFLENAHNMGIDLTCLQKVVLSHGHYDHSGGLRDFLQLKPNTVVIAHPDVFKKRYCVESGKDPREIGMPDNVLTYRKNFVVTRESTEVFPGCITTGEITRVKSNQNIINSFFLDPQGKSVDQIMDDQSLILETSHGVGVILGCCHAGLFNTLNRAFELTGKKSFCFVIGGMHLSNAPEKIIRQTVDALLEYGVKSVGAAHCTGYRGLLALKRLYPGEVFSCDVGTVVYY